MRSQTEILNTRLSMVCNDILHVNALFGKSILITGASGFIGQAFIDTIMFLNLSFDANIKIFACGRNLEKLCCLLKKYLPYENLKLIGCDSVGHIDLNGPVDYIIHCAAVTYPSLFKKAPLQTLITNIELTKSAIQCAVRNKATRFLYLSSVEVYGNPLPSQGPFFENQQGYLKLDDPRSVYPESKRIGELLCLSQMYESGLDYIVVRPAKTYGLTLIDSDERAVSHFIRSAAKKDDIVLFTKGITKFSFCNVFDLTSSSLSLLTQGKCGESYNVASIDSDMSIFEFASICAEYGDVRVVLQNTNQEMGYAKFEHTLVDCSKISKLGIISKIPLRDGIKEAIDYCNAKSIVDGF
ncbi:MAG: NAD(P)-dependent oxidoreductase [Christensenellaceae bacterium]|jgi:nucleoside-diphosphate-sugar epimerase|nr:NAD(P)-dependent oxidoreductase [Christensenellaceae bacterium]